MRDVFRDSGFPVEARQEGNEIEVNLSIVPSQKPCAACGENIQASPSSQLERLAAAVQARLGGQVRDLQLLLRDNGLVLRGRTRTYYAKQLAQHAVMKVTEQRIWANEIKVV